MTLEERICKHLRELPERPFWRPPAGMPDFTSNDYLGLIHDGIIQETLRRVPPSLLRGAGASRYLGGDAEPFHAVEKEALILWGRPSESALFFPSGLVANLSFWSSIPQRGDIVIFDREVHASIRQGIRLSGATAWGFPHNDWDAAEAKLRRSPKVPFLVIESLYSMRGTSPDAQALQELAQRYEFHLVVDEAHTTFTLAGGRSWSDIVGLKPLARLFTFGKAVGLAGAVWVGAPWLIEYLRRVGFGGIYTTALPPFIGWAVADILRRSPEWEARRTYLTALVSKVKAVLEARGIPYQGLQGPIALLYTAPSPLPLKKLYPPTVAEPAYRLSLHAHNTIEEVRQIFEG